MDKEEKHEHAKFLLYQIQQEMSQGQENKDCVVQCEDGSFRTSAIVIFSLSPVLASLCIHSEDPVIIIPQLLMGELLLFMKYVFTNKIGEMFSFEDVSVIERVSSLLYIDRVYEDVTTSIHELKRSTQPGKLQHSFSSEDTKAIEDNQIEGKAPSQREQHQTFKVKRIKEQEKLKTCVLCPYCGEETGFTILMKHIKQKHPEHENTCLICHLSFHNRTDLESHLVLHYKEENPYYIHCERCEYVCVTQYQIQRHRKSHNIKKFKSINCQYCPRVFQVQDKYNKHLAQHLTGKENDERQFKCEQCGKQFFKQRDLDRHIKSHTGIKSYFCNECDSKFVDSTRLKQHKWIHSNVKSFQCSLCDKMFRHKSHLSSHIASYHPESKLNNILKCQHCNKTFAFEYKLKQHLEWHRIDNSERVECDDVDYSVTNINVVH